MVTRVNTSVSTRIPLMYNERKVQKAEAKLLFASKFPWEPEHLSIKRKLAAFRKLTCQNTWSKRHTLHLSLNFSPNDRLGTDRLIKVASTYMDKIGFGDQPYLVYQHLDAAHPHLHVVTVKVAHGGKYITGFDGGMARYYDACREVEALYGLERAAAYSKQNKIQTAPPVLRRVHYGQKTSWAAICEVVTGVLKSYKCTSLIELNAVLGQFGIRAFGGKPGSLMHEKKGLMYDFINERGQFVGRPIKASELQGKPTLKKLERLFAANRLNRGHFKDRLQFILDKAMNAAGTAQLESYLKAQGIRILFSKNQQGEKYGVTYIDNRTRAAFSDLVMGTKYSAANMEAAINAVIQRTIGNNKDDGQEHMPGHELDRPTKQTSSPLQQHRHVQRPIESIPASDLAVISIHRERRVYEYEAERRLVQARKLALEQHRQRAAELGL